MKSMSKLKKRGRAKGECRKLTVLNERKIIETMINVMPNDYTEKPFWTKEGVKTLIEKELNIHMPITTVRDYLHRWNLIDNKTISIKKNIRQKHNFRRWLWDIYTPIEKNARKNNATIVWVESYFLVRFPEDITKETIHNKSWKVKCYQMKIVMPYGEKAFILSSARFGGFDFINFLKNIVRDSDRKIYLFLKIKKIYPVKPVKEWLDKNIDKIEVFYVRVR